MWIGHSSCRGMTGLFCLGLIFVVGCGPQKRPPDHEPKPVHNHHDAVEETATTAESASHQHKQNQVNGKLVAERAADDPLNVAEDGREEIVTNAEPPAHDTPDVTWSITGMLLEQTDSTSGQVAPKRQLEAALALYRQAMNRWRDGDAEQAYRVLDQAYGLLVHIDERNHPEVLQDKDDLRLLIAKRVVEFHAAQRTTIGDPSKVIPLDMNEHVAREIRRFIGPERQFFLESYRRSGRYMPMILATLREQGLPEQLAWLPLIESGFKTNALSRARALGLWQFIPSTGYRFGLTRDQWVDQRMDPERSTQAALQYLRELHNLFGDWLTALAAYNCGEGRVQRLIRRQQVNYLDHFWDLYDYLPQETARYVPRYLAALKILSNPEAYGMELPTPDTPVAATVVAIDHSLRLQDLAAATPADFESLRSLNPELRYGITPDRRYALRVPFKVAEAIEAAWFDLSEYRPSAEDETIHVVRRGESLSMIAKRYGVSIQRLVAFNGLSEQHRIWPGQKLIMPGQSASSIATTMVSVHTGPNRHVVAPGETLWRISRRYNTTVNALRKLNHLQGNDLLVGQVLVIRQAITEDKVYFVKRGDTLAKIAQIHGVGLQALLQKNGLGPADRIYPNQKLELPGK